jgi:microcystin-dependent protein
MQLLAQRGHQPQQQYQQLQLQPQPQTQTQLQPQPQTQTQVQVHVEDKPGSKGTLILVGFIVAFLAIFICYYTMPDVGVIVGMVAYFPIPYTVGVSGWMPCIGTSLSQDKYPKLFKAISTIFGKGLGTTTFQLPDLRGNFIRSMDAGAGIDVGRTMTNMPQPATAVLPTIGELKIPPTNQWVASANNTHNIATGVMNTDPPVMINAQRYLTLRPQNIALYAYIKY